MLKLTVLDNFQCEKPLTILSAQEFLSLIAEVKQYGFESECLNWQQDENNRLILNFEHYSNFFTLDTGYFQLDLELVLKRAKEEKHFVFMAEFISTPKNQTITDVIEEKSNMPYCIYIYNTKTGKIDKYQPYLKTRKL